MSNLSGTWESQCCNAVQIKSLKVNIMCICFLQDVALNSLRFLFDGQRINDDQTPKDVSIGKCGGRICLTIWGVNH